MINIKRIYEPTSPEDGKRILIDRLWPRGKSKKEADIDEWMKQIAPSNELRKWFAHDPQKFNEFTKRYRRELEDSAFQEEISLLVQMHKEGTITLLYSAKDEEFNQAIVLKEYLLGKS